MFERSQIGCRPKCPADRVSALGRVHLGHPAYKALSGMVEGCCAGLRCETESSEIVSGLHSADVHMRSSASYF